MLIPIGEVAALYRYPVKSMAGEPVESVEVGWHGLAGDRRLALRRVDDRGGFPWLTASKLPALLRYVPRSWASGPGGELPTQVRTPEGREWPIYGAELADEIGRLHGSPVEMTHLSRGIFDEASVSVIGSATVEEIGRLSALSADVRRFRPNLLLTTRQGRPFEEEDWVGGNLIFGEGDARVVIAVTNYDERCSMVNFDPETAHSSPEVLKAIVAARGNKAGVYGAVVRRGSIRTGQPVFFSPAPGA